MWPTASAMAFMAGMWVFLTQIDKLILSRILSLEAFGYFSLAIAVAGGVLILTPPLNQVLQPRMIILAVQGRSDELQTLYPVSYTHLDVYKRQTLTRKNSGGFTRKSWLKR